LKTKKLIFIVGLFLTIQSLFAQYEVKHAVQFGLSRTEFKGTDFARYWRLKPFSGAYFGYTVNANFDNAYELTTGLILSQKGYVSDYDTVSYYDAIFPDNLGTVKDLRNLFRFEDDLTLTYLEFPFILKRRISTVFVPYIGFNVSVLMNANIDYKYIGYEVGLVVDDTGHITDEEYISEYYRIGKDGDASFFLGMEVRATDWIGINLQYEWGMVKLDTYGKTNTRINSIKMGVFFVFNRH
jgi:hypothetical protein